MNARMVASGNRRVIFTVSKGNKPCPCASMTVLQDISLTENSGTSTAINAIRRLAPEPTDSRWDPETLPDDEDDDEPRWTELQIASRKGDLGRVTELLSSCKTSEQRRALVNAQAVGWYGQTALQAACFHEREEVVQALLDAGADISAPGGNNIYRNAFEYACGTGMLSSNEVKLCALLILESTGNMHIIQMLLDAGATQYVNPKKVTRYQGRTPIQAAAEGGHKAVVSLLLDLGADINAPPSPLGGCTALQAASFGGHVDVVEFLISRGADVNAPAARGNGCFTALQGAVHAGEPEVVEILLRSGAHVNAPGPAAGSHKGGTALHAAAARGHIEMVERLLAAGADPNCRAGSRRQTPLQCAHLIGRTDIEDVLVRAGAVGPRVGGQLLFPSVRARSWSRNEIGVDVQPQLRE